MNIRLNKHERKETLYYVSVEKFISANNSKGKAKNFSFLSSVFDFEKLSIVMFIFLAL